MKIVFRLAMEISLINLSLNLSLFQIAMEKRRNTFERFQRWGFGQRSSSNNDLATTPPPGEPKKKDKSERLKELTELLKSTRIPSLTGFNRNTLRETSCSPPPVPPPRRQRSGLSVEKSFEKMESIEDNEMPTPGKITQRKISVPSMKINERAVSPGQIKITKPLHVSISSPHFKSLLEKSQPPHTTDCNDIPLHAEELFSLPKVEPKTIVGSYTQKSIPYRSASFSQVDFNSGKYSLGSPELKVPKEPNRNSASLLESSTYPRRRGDLRLLRNMKLGSPGPKAEQDHIIAEEPSPEHEDRRLSTLETIDSYDFDDHPVDGDPEAAVVVGDICVPNLSGDNVTGEVKVKENCGDGERNNENEVQSKTNDEVPTSLSEISGESEDRPQETESKSPDNLLSDKNIYQTACEIPTPVFECCGKEVEQLTEWFQLPADSSLPANQTTPAELVTPEIPSVAITRSESGQSNTRTTKSDSPDSCYVEMRKKNTFSSDSGTSKQSSLEKNDEPPPAEERRKIDKSKRRKGIYIQWPMTGLAKAPGGGDSSWDMDSPDMLSPDCDDKLKLNINLGLAAANFDCLSTASCEPLTPDSDNYHQKLRWPNTKPNGNGRKKSLTYQSSDEKDDPPKEVHHKRTAMLRMDSTSDNESDRATSREPHSASPTPGGGDDPKRYSKRPLRGPYGQMLEAEMKKAAKVHYNEILEDLRATDL